MKDYPLEYMKFLAQATKRRNYAQPCSRYPGSSSYVYRLHPANDKVVQVGVLLCARLNYDRAEHEAAKRESKKLQWNVLPREGAMHAHFELHRNGIHIFKYNEHLVYPLADEVIAKYGKHLEGRTSIAPYGSPSGSSNPADISLNNALHQFGIFHKGNGIRDFPGHRWSGRGGEHGTFGPNMLGHVFWDQATGKISGHVHTPERVVQEALRTRLNKALRKTYKRMRVLSRMGVNLLEQEPLNVPATSITASALLDQMDAFDARNMRETQDLAWQLAWRLKPTYYAANLKHLGPNGLLDSPRILERVRRALSRELKIVTYK